MILADTTTPPEGPPQSRGCCPAAGGARARRSEIVWAGRRSTTSRRSAARERRAARRARTSTAAALCGDDARRRPADRVRRGERGRPEGCWYQLVERRLEARRDRGGADDREGTVLRWRKMPEPARSRRRRRPRPEARRAPDWLERESTAEPPPPRRCRLRARSMRPRRHAPPPGGRGAPRRRSRAATSCIACCRRCPTFRAGRAEAARGYLARNGRDSAPRSGSANAGQVHAVLGDSRFADLFWAGQPGRGADRRPLTGRRTSWFRTGRPAGRHRRRVLIADYSESPGPAPARGIPGLRGAAGALSRGARPALSGHGIRAAMIWTSAGSDGAAATALDQALAGSPPRDAP